MTELKTCPFCGGEPELYSYFIKGVANRKHFKYRCKCCGATQRYHETRTRTKAAIAWNRRAKDESN